MIIRNEPQGNLKMESGGTDINSLRSNAHVGIFSITNSLDKQALLLLHTITMYFHHKPEYLFLLRYKTDLCM